MTFLENSAKQREDMVYPLLFGSNNRGIFNLTEEIFNNNFSGIEIDPVWLTFGSFEYLPNNDRDSYVYVSSGMSSPWAADEPREYSGFGTEFCIETETQSDWAIKLLNIMIAYNLLIASGYYENQKLINYWHRIPFNISESIKAILAIRSTSLPNMFELQSGKVNLIHFIGITDLELNFAKNNSSEELMKKFLLVTNNIKSLNILDRNSLL